MDALKLDKFRDILLKMKDDIVTTEINLDSIQGEKVADDVDVAASDSAASLATKFITRKNSYLKRIEQTLKKIEQGTYGECESCGEEISERRLVARPTALLCIDCKEEEEKMEQKEKERMRGGFLADWE